MCKTVAAACVLAVGGLVNTPVSAQAWDYGVDAELGFIHTDNVFLAEDGMESSENVFTIKPEFWLQSDTDRVQANLRYRPQAYFYSDNSDADEVFHTVDASLTNTLVRDRLFLYLSAVNYQSIETPEGRFPTSNLPISGNRVDSRTLAARPYWRQRVGQADLRAEVGYYDLEYDDSQYQGSTQKLANLNINNFERQQGLAWGLDYNFRRMEYELSTPWEFQRASLNLGFWVTATTRIFGVGGAETSYANLFDSNMDEDFWEAGIQYKPNQRMDFEFAAGERSYGSSFRGRFTYALRRGDISLRYTEGPSTRGELGFERRPIRDTDNLDGILDQPGEDDRFIRRRGEFNANIELNKSKLTLRIFSERRDLRTGADGEALADEELSGAAVRWSWDFGTKTTLGIGADVSKRDQQTRADDLMRARVDLSYQLSPKTSIRGEAAHSAQDGGASSTFDYDENQLRLILRTEF